MNTSTKKESAFKPIFLFREDNKILRVKERIIRGANLLNKFIDETETALKLKLTDNEKIEIKDKGIRAIENRLKESFPFEKATLEFNLQALGLDIKPLQEFYAKNEALWSSFNYDLLDDLFKPVEFEQYNQIKALSHYTTNIAQNELLSTAKKLSKTFDSLHDANLVNPDASGEIANITNLLIAKYIDGKVKIVPNLEFIRKYKG
ncbi:hypothetical protein ES692_05940 [Psychroserpens burtonensis]|uniref:Uncharacterized protein n=1 Tax=Psychroserpens burtonensis TaxID=49278 RepID=A0A5C7BHY7_9FLAO|nr:hypothetical protein [Psychroserpens burtonensis]TXE18582.1 hypothetical protein ES692_05940 [Psychroserpens burtonensis]